MKICSKCKIPKDESEFAKNTRTKDGLRCECKKCKHIDWKKYSDKKRKNKAIQGAGENMNIFDNPTTFESAIKIIELQKAIFWKFQCDNGKHPTEEEESSIVKNMDYNAKEALLKDFYENRYKSKIAKQELLTQEKKAVLYYFMKDYGRFPNTEEENAYTKDADLVKMVAELQRTTKKIKGEMK